MIPAFGADYQYGSNLLKNIYGQVDNAIGLTHGHEGGMTLIPPTLEIVDKVERHTIDGVDGFVEAVSAENLIAGNALSRRGGGGASVRSHA